MSIFDRLASRLGYAPKAMATVSSSRAVLDIFNPEGLPGGLPVLNESAAWTVSAIAACVNLISGAIASMPANVLRREQDWTLTRIYDDPLWWVLNEEMTPRWSAATGWEYLIASRLLLGDAFALILRDPNGRVLGIEPVHPSRVRVIVSPNGRRLIYEVAPDMTITSPLPGTRTMVVDQDDMIHLTGPGFDGVRSPSPLRHSLRMAGAAAYATQGYSAQFFANQARPDYAIVAPPKATFSPETIDRMKAEIDERHRGNVNAHRPMFLSGGADVKTLSMSMEDLQLIQTRQFQIEEIARAYGVPPFMIGHNEKTTSWGSGVEQMGTAFVRYTLSSHLTKIHNEFNRKLFRTYAKVIEFDTFELERADMQSMFTAFRMAIGRAGEPGFLSVDEVRAYLNRGKAPADINKGIGNAPPAQPAQP